MPAEKQYTRQVTERFLQEMDRVVGFNKERKVTQYEFGEKVGITPNNLTRMKKGPPNYVTMEACCRLCHHYGTDPGWLLMGEDHEEKVDQRIEKLDGMILHLKKSISVLTGPKFGNKAGKKKG